MEHVIWFVVAGLLFISMALAGSAVARLPLTTAILYLGTGVVLGPHAAGLLQLDVIAHAPALERVTEIAVIVSLFTAGLKLRVPVLDARWLIAIRLAVISMALTVALIATAVVFVLGVPWVVGSLLSTHLLSWRVLWLAPLLFLAVRPLSVLAGLAGAGVTRRELALTSWFGVRGVGSAYYLAYAINGGLPVEFRDSIISLTLAVMAASIVIHGITVTPLMARWGEKAEARG